MPKQSYKVYLNVYHFTTLNPCLSFFGCPAYHTAIQIHGIEFSYCVVDIEQSETGVISSEPQGNDFIFERKVFVGQTYFGKEKVQRIINDLSKKYTCGNYHMFRNNCNHFSEEFARKLTGKTLEKKIFRLTDCLTYLCCCLPHGWVSGRWALELQNNQLIQNTENK